MSDDYQRLTDARGRVTFVADLPRAVAARWLEEYRSWFPEPESPTSGETVASCGPCTGGRIALLDDEHGELFLKREGEQSARRRLLARLGRPGRAARSFRLGCALYAAGVATSRPLALVESLLESGRQESCLVLARLRGRSLREILAEGLPESESERDSLLRSVAQAIAQLHRAGFRQRDLKAANILVDEEEATAHLVDHDGMTYLGKLPVRVRVRDLARLAVSFRAPAALAAGVREVDWERLLEFYFTAYHGDVVPTSEREAFGRGIERWAARKVRRNYWRRRPVT